MRYRSRVDENQRDITKALRQLGFSVQPLHVIGKGCPDLLVGHRGQNFLLEIKSGGKSASEKRLTEDEADWHAKWAGQVAVVETQEQAVKAVFAALVRK